MTAIREAVAQGWLALGPGNFMGWQDDCNCEQCVTQRAAYVALFGDVTNRATGAAEVSDGS